MSLDSSAVFSALGMQQDLRSNMARTSVYNATTLMQKGKYKEAVGVLKMATAYDPSLTDAYSLMGQSYLKLKDNKAAKAAYQMVTRLDRNNDSAFIAMGNIDVADKKYAEAEKEFKQAIQANPRNELAPYVLGQLYLTTDRNKEAALQFQKVTRMVPKDGNGYYSLGVALNKLGKYDDAVAQLTKAVSLKKDFALAYAELGNSYVKLDKRDKAQTQVDTLRKIMTYQAQELAAGLTAQLKRPKIASHNPANSSLKLIFGAMTPLMTLDPSYVNAPNKTKDFTVQFQFDSQMDVKSVMDPVNWSIRKAAGGTAGRYDNGVFMMMDQQTNIPPMPKAVSYDPSTRQATLTITITQGDTGAGVIDPSHMVFKFSGTDVNGKTMDPTADEYDSFAYKPF